MKRKSYGLRWAILTPEGICPDLFESRRIAEAYSKFGDETIRVEILAAPTKKRKKERKP